MQWSREDELAWSPIGAAMAVEIEADLDAQGEIVGWRDDVWSNGHVSRPGRAAIPTLLAASQLAKPFERFVAVNPPLANGGGAERNAVPLYDFPRLAVTCHRLLTMPIRTSALRTLGAFANVFAIESFMDELAAERGEDPLAFRLRHLKDPRARAVLEAAADAPAGARRRKRRRRRATASASRATRTSAPTAPWWPRSRRDADIRVRRLVVAVDVGEVDQSRTAWPTRSRAAPSRPPAGR